MKRPILFGAIFLVFDQLLKWYFQSYFDGRILQITKGFGFTYVTNPGIWINRNISTEALLVIQVLAVLVWVASFYLVKYYRTFYRKSLYIDLSFGLFTTAVFGNVFLDRLLHGFIRDFFITPIAVANFADLAGNLVMVFVALEFIAYPKARPLLKIGSPNDWWRNFREFIAFVSMRKPK